MLTIKCVAQGFNRAYQFVIEKMAATLPVVAQAQVHRKPSAGYSEGMENAPKSGIGNLSVRVVDLQRFSAVLPAAQNGHFFRQTLRKKCLFCAVGIFAFFRTPLPLGERWWQNQG
jgi:hypothetical protein